MNISKIFFRLIIILVPLSSSAQVDRSSKNGISISPAFELLRSTHGNAFYAPSLKANYNITRQFELGMGVEYSSTPEHHDNGFILNKLRFLPVYGNLKYNFKGDKQVRFYAETSLGISFNKYDIADEVTPLNTSTTREQGFYVYTGLGAKYAISKAVATFLGVGFKGYKMSFDDLDINPHGLSFSAGFSFL